MDPGAILEVSAACEQMAATLADVLRCDGVDMSDAALRAFVAHEVFLVAQELATFVRLSVDDLPPLALEDEALVYEALRRYDEEWAA